MSANLESLMYVSNESNGRFAPWHGLGTPVEEAPNSAAAIELAGLNWKVNPQPIYTDFPNGGKIEIPNAKANVRDVDNKVLGIVTDRYQIVQNIEAFDFTDSLIGEGCTYETAGSLDGGKKVFLLVKMPEKKILDEEFDPYICFTNTFDGSGSIKACCTNVRVVCQNTLNLALSTAARKWSTRHVGNISDKLSEAHRTLELAIKYNDELAKFAEVAANTPITKDEEVKIITELFPIRETMSKRMVENVEKNRKNFENCMVAIDLMPFYGTMWGLLNAASDFTYHTAPNRITVGMQENRMKKCIEGAEIFDKILAMHPVRV